MSDLSTPFLYVGREARDTGASIKIALQHLENHFYLCLGKTGAGKSHTIRNIMDQLYGYHTVQSPRGSRPPTFHVLGYHPDFDYSFFEKSGANRNIGPESINVLDLDYTEGDASINILAPLSDSESYRYRAIEDFIAFCRVAHSGIGIVQEKYLRDILTPLYGKIKKSEDRYPNAKDLLDEIYYIKSCLGNGLNGDINSGLARLREKRSEIERKIKNKEYDTKGIEEAREKLNEIEGEMLDLFSTLVKQDKAWLSDEYFANMDVRIVRSLEPLVAEMVRPGFFTRQTSKRPLPGVINYYKMDRLGPAHKKLLTHVLLSRLYAGAELMTPLDRINMPFAETYIVADELQYIRSAAAEGGPMDTIMNGSRKFNMGMICGGQGAEQVTGPMANAFSLKFLLAQEYAAYPNCEKYFGVKKGAMQQVVPKKSAMFCGAGAKTLVNLFE